MPCKTLAIAACLFLTACGCQGMRQGIIESPLTQNEQQAALLKIVPLGTPREQAEQLLNKAGIEYVKAPRNTVIHCTVWNQPGGDRWHINVALLFDRNKELYAVRESDAQIEAAADEQAPARGASPWDKTAESILPVEEQPAARDTDEPRRAFAAP